MIVRLPSFRSLPDVTTIIPINNPGPPIDQGDGILGISRNWTDGLQPGSQLVPNFKARYEKAINISAQAESGFMLGTPPVTMQRQYDAKLIDALRRVNLYYKWDRLCTAENDVFKNCRTSSQVSRLKSALQDVDKALKSYDKLELTMARADPTWKSDYVDLSYTPAPGGASSSSSAMTTSQPLWPKLLMYGIPAVVLLAGGAYLLLKKPKPRPAAAVAGYRRRRRR